MTSNTAARELALALINHADTMTPTEYDTTKQHLSCHYEDDYGTATFEDALEGWDTEEEIIAALTYPYC